MSALAFSFSNVSRALQMMNGVSAERASAFEGRLKHYQRQGFPPGINTGRGRAATYTIDHAVRLAFALEFNQVGLNPERAIALVKWHDDLIRSGISSVVSATGFLHARITCLCFDPANLSDLSDFPDDMARSTFYVFDQGQLLLGFGEWRADGPRRGAVINMSAVIADLVEGLHILTDRPHAELFQDLHRWASEAAHVDDPEA